MHQPILANLSLKCIYLTVDMMHPMLQCQYILTVWAKSHQASGVDFRREVRKLYPFHISHKFIYINGFTVNLCTVESHGYLL